MATIPKAAYYTIIYHKYTILDTKRTPKWVIYYDVNGNQLEMTSIRTLDNFYVRLDPEFIHKIRPKKITVHKYSTNEKLRAVRIWYPSGGLHSSVLFMKQNCESLESVINKFKLFESQHNAFDFDWALKNTKFVDIDTQPWYTKLCCST